MRKLAKSETRLLLIFAAALFVAVNLFAVRAWHTHRLAVVSAVSKARSELAASHSWMVAAESLEAAREWIKQHPSPVEKPDAANTELLKNVRAMAEKSGLKIVEETLLPGEEGGDIRAAVLQTKITGPFSGVAAFLFELQNPTSWRAVEKLMIRSDNEPPNVIVDLEIHQYFRTPESDTNAPSSE